MDTTIKAVLPEGRTAKYEDDGGNVSWDDEAVTKASAQGAAGGSLGGIQIDVGFGPGVVPTRATPVRATTANIRPRPRARGAGRPAVRGASKRSSAKSGDSGDDSDSSEPPQDGRPPCACGCGLSMVGMRRGAKYLNEAHGSRNRQQRKRWLARGWDPDAPDPDVSLDDPYFRFDGKVSYEMLRKRVEEGCRCNGHHIADPEDGHCIKCGHRRGGNLPSMKTVPARSFVSSHAPPHRNLRYGDRKRKPVTPFVDESIIRKAA
jgi:hypothetical protein